ncbi:hypothetical protein EV421DRAFT_1909166 [Armillaria borealis]|uniref:Uncharacterized protein n=1 Tax=Armillaria borealis TaxID=47425 RepID=A0AA39MH60_9AGAR|nr:hypothetical protein EV421DRAFT_1909166 [Armillaria borealis]
MSSKQPPSAGAMFNKSFADLSSVLADTKLVPKSWFSEAAKIWAWANVGAVIIRPTPELATQITNEALRLSYHHEGFEVRLLRLLVGYAISSTLNPDITKALKTTRTLVLDEVNTLLNIGFHNEVSPTIRDLPPTPEHGVKIKASATNDGDDAPPANHLPPSLLPTHAAVSNALSLEVHARDQVKCVLADGVYTSGPNSQVLQRCSLLVFNWMLYFLSTFAVMALLGVVGDWWEFETHALYPLTGVPWTCQTSLLLTEIVVDEVDDSFKRFAAPAGCQTRSKDYFFLVVCATTQVLSPQIIPAKLLTTVVLRRPKTVSPPPSPL